MIDRRPKSSRNRGTIRTISEIQATPISIFVVSDEAIPRDALVHLLKACPEYRVIGNTTVEGALSADWELRPAVALVHAGNLTPQVLALVKVLSARNIPVVVILRQRNAWQVQAYRKAGAIGLVLVEATSMQMFNVIRAAVMRRPSVDPVLAGALLETVSGPLTLSAPELSVREAQVLRYLAYGYSNVQIACRLTVSTKSIETYRSRLMEKLELRDRADIVRFALLTGILAASNVDDLAS